MKELLLAIESELKSKQSVVPEGNISIVPWESYLPSSSNTPAICIKDGPIDIVRLAGDTDEKTMHVLIAVWVQILDQPGSSVVGVDPDPGVLELAKLVCSILNDNMLSLSGMQDGYCIRERGSELMGAKTLTLQRKIVEFRYVWEVENNPT
ncbi:hypothetical protein [Desulforhopalus singaporensis]|uniref:DUF3168 domain-containing protein n=1 Tax=Desulforhopalus singaporensis TaxID=91360 RepID=A0A1H0VF25_9BACT|nr:hypothetical protein [Desulforhopalus singaporensis]SDP77087.1 hypothetical protein SAMN05660330_04034 [Desulforhopalus singaporensis]